MAQGYLPWRVARPLLSHATAAAVLCCTAPATVPDMHQVMVISLHVYHAYACVDTLSCQSLPAILCRFLTRYMLAPDKGQPMVVTGAMSAWPALTRWQDLAYLTRVAGARTVPVELGRHYLAQGWGQRLMLFSDFVKLHIQTEAAQAHIQTDALKPTTHVAQSQMQADRSERESTASRQAAKAAGALRVSASGVSSKQQQQHPESLPGESTCCAGEQASVLAAGSGAACCSAQDTQQMQAQPPNIQQTVSVAPKEAQRCQHVGEPQAAAETGAPMVNGDTVPQAVTGYLAQHPLFDQIPALRNDIQEPAYCVLGEGEVQSVNAWFGPAGTVSLALSAAFCVALVP